jgi:excisionase family DNA binding protein
MDAHPNWIEDLPNFTPQEVADRVGLSYHAVLRAIHRGELAAYKLCGRVRLRKEDVLAWIEQARIELEQFGPPSPQDAPPPRTGSLEALRELERRFAP